MEILERDIFNYFFYPSRLDEDKLFYLQNSEFLKKDFEFLTEIKNYYKEKIPQEIIEKIKKLIDKNNRTKIITFVKTKFNNSLKSDHLVLAADSSKFDKKQEVETFEDEDSNYLIKIISNIYSNKVFLFNKNNLEMQNVKLTLEPSGQSHIMKSSNQPIIISPKEEITNISITTESEEY